MVSWQKAVIGEFIIKQLMVTCRVSVGGVSECVDSVCSSKGAAHLTIVPPVQKILETSLTLLMA